MMRSAKLLTAIVAAILVLPHPRSFAKPRALLPDLRIKPIEGTLTHSCAGPLLLRVSLSFEVQNIGTGAAVSPSPIYQWVAIRDIGGGPPVPELMWSAGGPAELAPKHSLTYTAQPLLRQFPVFTAEVPVGSPGPVGGIPIGFPKRYDVKFVIMADPSKSILESNELNNGVGFDVQKDNKPKLTNVEPGLCA
jgi:hypothetical protein